MSDEENDDPWDYWKKLTAGDNFSDSSSDEDYDIDLETARLRDVLAERKRRHKENKGKFSDVEDDMEDLFDAIERLDGFDLDDIALPETQVEKEMAFGMQEEARQKEAKEKRQRALILAKEKEIKEARSFEFELSDPPSSDDGHDPHEEVSDEDAPAVGRKRRRPKRLLRIRLEFDEENFNDPSQICKGLCFTDVNQFRKAVKSYHIMQGRNYKFMKNKMHKVKLHCLEPGCRFYLFASKISGEPTFMIRDDVVPHSCGITRDSSRINSTWLAKHYEQYFRADPNWKVDAFMPSTGRGMTKAPAADNAPGSGRGGGKGRASANNSQARLSQVSQASSTTRRGRGRGRGRANAIDTRVYGRTGSGRIASWFNIASQAATRDS